MAFGKRDFANKYSGNIFGVLWLIAGIVPCFFGESLLGSTSVLAEYSYLVKKVSLLVYILSLVKAFSSLLVHLVFLAFAVVIYLACGHALGSRLYRYATICCAWWYW